MYMMSNETASFTLGIYQWRVMSLLKSKLLQWRFMILSAENNSLKISFSLIFQSYILKETRNAV